MQTALHKAAVHGHLHVVKYLLSIPDGKPNVHAQDNDGWTPLHNACSEVNISRDRHVVLGDKAFDLFPLSRVILILSSGFANTLVQLMKSPLKTMVHRVLVALI